MAKRKRPHAFTKEFHRQLDDLMDRIKRRAEEAGTPVACRGAGCSWCCSEPVYATKAEAKLLAHRVRELPTLERQRIEVDLLRVLGLLQASPLWSQELPAATEYMRLQLPCPLLTADGRCGVYEDRPAGCRMHFARKPPEPYCADVEYRPHQQHIATGLYAKDKLLAVAAHGDADFDHLVVLLANELLGLEVRSGAGYRVEVK